MADKNELEKYYDRLKAAIDNEIESFDNNSDRSHNAVVMRLMFEHAQTINMFCGELSILREGFKKYVDENVGDKCIMDDMYSSLHTFLKKDNSKFNIILENNKSEYFEDVICKDIFKTAYDEQKIKVYALKRDLALKESISHFTFTDNKILRIEQDKAKHNALCAFFKDDIYDSFRSVFGTLMNFVEDVNIPFVNGKCS